MVNKMLKGMVIKMRNQTKNSILLLIAALIWGFAFVAQSSGGELIGPYTFNCIRNLIGSVVLIPIIYLFDKIGISKKPSTKAEIKKLILGGITTGIALFFASNLQQVGINLGTSAGKAGFLTACYILIVPVLGIFLNKKCPINVWFAVMAALVGLYLLCKTDTLTLTFPDILLLLCALVFSIQILCVDHFSILVDPARLSCIEFLVCGICSSIPMLITEVGFTTDSINNWLISLTIPTAWISILYAGICSCGIAYTLQIFGQRNLNPTIASLIMSLESVFSVLGGWLILNEKLSSRELIGCAIIFGSIIFSQIPAKPKSRRK